MSASAGLLRTRSSASGPGLECIEGSFATWKNDERPVSLGDLGDGAGEALGRGWRDNGAGRGMAGPQAGGLPRVSYRDRLDVRPTQRSNAVQRAAQVGVGHERSHGRTRYPRPHCPFAS
jgi:hypothetical protein